MPLYIDDLPPLALPHAYMHALREFARSAGDDPVVPSVALKLLRLYVQPLVPAEYRSAFQLGGQQASWSRIHMLYPELAFASEGRDRNLLAAATVVDLVVRHTTRPAREISLPTSLEVSSFVRMCGLLGLPLTPVSAQQGTQELRLYDFCKYCWLPVRWHGVCAHHSTTPSTVQHRSPRCAVTSLKQVQRLRPRFEQRLTALLTAEELEFHDSEFAAPVLVPPSGLEGWLASRRPHLAAAVASSRHSTESRPIKRLLDLLYGDIADPIANSIGSAVHLLTPVTARAEAWLAAYEARPRRGGARSRGKPAASEGQSVDGLSFDMIILADDGAPSLDATLQKEALRYLELTRANQATDLSLREAAITGVAPPVSGLLGLLHAKGLDQTESAHAEGATGLELSTTRTWCCVVSTRPYSTVAADLNANGSLESPEVDLVCSEDSSKALTLVELLSEVTRRHAVDARRCVVVGDSVEKARAATAAGMHFVDLRELLKIAVASDSIEAADQ